VLLTPSKSSYGQELFEDVGICTGSVSPNIDTYSSPKYIIYRKIIKVSLNTYVALKVTLTIPVTAASAERCFTKPKLIKTYLRSTACKERLSALVIIFTEYNLASKLNYSLL
jgi:hypothetical protein